MKCPGCRVDLAPSGEVFVDGRRMTIYQCDTCERDILFGGQVFRAALTFAVDEDGGVFTADTFEPLPGFGSDFSAN